MREKQQCDRVLTWRVMWCPSQMARRSASDSVDMVTWRWWWWRWLGQQSLPAQPAVNRRLTPFPTSLGRPLRPTALTGPRCVQQATAGSSCLWPCATDAAGSAGVVGAVNAQRVPGSGIALASGSGVALASGSGVAPASCCRNDSRGVGDWRPGVHSAQQPVAVKVMMMMSRSTRIPFSGNNCNRGGRRRQRQQHQQVTGPPCAPLDRPPPGVQG